MSVSLDFVEQAQHKGVKNKKQNGNEDEDVAYALASVRENGMKKKNK